MIEVVCAADQARCSPRGAVTGPIYLRLPNACFPEEGWDDFPVVLLGWWAQALARLASGGGGAEKLQFMDGPYFVTLDRAGDGDIRFQCVSEQGRRQVEAEGLVSRAALEDQVRRAGLTLAAAARDRGWNSRDLPTLEEALGAL